MTGTCRFCGQMRELNAGSQAEADEQASRSCDCANSGDYARKMAPRRRWRRSAKATTSRTHR